jgi:hypothetical protein
VGRSFSSLSIDFLPAHTLAYRLQMLGIRPV